MGEPLRIDSVRNVRMTSPAEEPPPPESTNDAERQATALTSASLPTRQPRTAEPPLTIAPPTAGGVTTRGVNASTAPAAGYTRPINLLDRAVHERDWSRAITLATTLVKALDGDDTGLTNADRDTLVNSVRAALREAERANSWSFAEILLSILALGIPFLVDALTTNEHERLEKLCGGAVLRERHRILDTMDVQAINGADAGDVRRVRKALLMLPAPILRQIQSTRFRVSGAQDPGGRFGVYFYGSNEVTIFAKPWYYFNFHQAPTAIHEAMHAYENLRGDHLSATAAFTAARTADWDDLRSYERRSDAAETLADTAVHYYGDIPWIVRLFMGDRPHLKRFMREEVTPR